jgi:hypothetical protein
VADDDVKCYVLNWPHSWGKETFMPLASVTCQDDGKKCFLVKELEFVDTETFIVLKK